MKDVLLACRVMGSWLLVAGPFYQAAMELGEQGATLRSVREKMRGQNVKPPSRWWWLLPPVAFVLDRLYRQKTSNEFFRLLTVKDLRSLLTFSGKATGWLMVTGGGLLLALNENWELTERLGQGWPVYAGLCAVGLVASYFTTVFRIRRSGQMIAQREAIGGADQPAAESSLEA